MLLPREWLEGGDGGVGKFCLPKPLHWSQSQGLKWFCEEEFVWCVDRVNPRGVKNALVVSDVIKKDNRKEMKNRKQDRDYRISRKPQD